MDQETNTKSSVEKTIKVLWFYIGLTVFFLLLSLPVTLITGNSIEAGKYIPAFPAIGLVLLGIFLLKKMQAKTDQLARERQQLMLKINSENSGRIV
jgi:cytochrome c biogenesis protein CcdA